MPHLVVESTVVVGHLAEVPHHEVRAVLRVQLPRQSLEGVRRLARHAHRDDARRHVAELHLSGERFLEEGTRFGGDTDGVLPLLLQVRLRAVDVDALGDGCGLRAGDLRGASHRIGDAVPAVGVLGGRLGCQRRSGGRGLGLGEHAPDVLGAVAGVDTVPPDAGHASRWPDGIVTF